MFYDLDSVFAEIAAEAEGPRQNALKAAIQGVRNAINLSYLEKYSDARPLLAGGHEEIPCGDVDNE